MVAFLIGLSVFIPSCYLFAIHLQMEIQGLVCAMIPQAIIVAIVQGTYIRCFLPEINDALKWPTQEVF